MMMVDGTRHSSSGFLRGCVEGFYGAGGPEFSANRVFYVVVMGEGHSSGFPVLACVYIRL